MSSKKPKMPEGAIWPALLTLREAAAYMSCSYGKVQDLAHRNVIPSYQQDGLIRIPKTELDKHIEVVVNAKKRKTGTF